MADYLDVLGQSHGGMLEVHRDPDFVCVKRSRNRPKVGLVSGCGAGNAPLAAGYVGPGMLDAASVGPGFASPSVEQIVAASRAADSGEGVLHVVPHLPGDTEAFQTAADRLREEGIRVRDVTIDDDIASFDPRHTTGRRALGAVLVAARVCGAAAGKGLHLNRVAQLCKDVNTGGKSLAATLRTGSQLHDAEVEIGTGLTGEAGSATLHRAGPREVAESLTDRILTDGPFKRYLTEWDLEKWAWHEVEVRDTGFRAGDKALCLVSSLGPQPVCDLRDFAGHVCDRAAEAGIEVVRSLTGHLMSAPNPNGLSVTLIRMTEEMLSLWDAAAQAPVLSGTAGKG